MTRFLSRILDDSQSGELNEEIERLFAYHQATKHTYHSVRASAHYLDWKNQPNPFRTYDGAPMTPLAPDPGFPDTGTFAAIGALGGRTQLAHENDPKNRYTAVQPDREWPTPSLFHSLVPER